MENSWIQWPRLEKWKTEYRFKWCHSQGESLGFFFLSVTLFSLNKVSRQVLINS